METTKLHVTGMSCMGCVNSVKRVLSDLAGVQTVEIDLASGQVQIAHEAHCTPEAMRQAIEAAGYRVSA